MMKRNSRTLGWIACLCALTAVAGCRSVEPPPPGPGCPDDVPQGDSEVCADEGRVCEYEYECEGYSCTCEGGTLKCEFYSIDDCVEPPPPPPTRACAEEELATDGLVGQGHFQCTFDELGAYDIDVRLSARPLGSVVDGEATDYEVQAQVVFPSDLSYDGMLLDDIELTIGNVEHAASASVEGPCSIDRSKTDAGGSFIAVVTPLGLESWTAVGGGTTLSVEELDFSISFGEEIDLQVDCVWSVLPSVTFDVQKPDYCDPDPCDNGVCESSDEGYECICDEGFTGLNCTDPIPPAPEDTLMFSLTSASTVNLLVRVPGGKTANMREETSELESCETRLYRSNGTGFVSCSAPATGTYETELYNPSPTAQRVYLQVNTRFADGRDGYKHGQWVDVPGNGSVRSFTWLRGSGSSNLFGSIQWKSQDWQRESNDLDLVLRRCNERYFDGCEPGQALGEATAAHPSGIAGCSFFQTGNITYTPQVDRRGNPDLLYTASEYFECGTNAPSGQYRLSVESRSPTAAILETLDYADDKDERSLTYKETVYAYGSRSFGIYVLDPAR